MRAGLRIARFSSSLFPSPVSPPLPSTRRRLHCKHSISILYSSKGKSEHVVENASSLRSDKEFGLTEENDKFLRWLRDKTGTEISSVLSLGNSAFGRSIFASKNIESGQCILKVPYVAQITSENLSSEIKASFPCDVGEVSRLAVVLLAEKKLGKNSEWATYISCLPCMNEMHNAILWSKDELEMVHDSPIYQETINRQTCIKKEYSALRPVLEKFLNVFGDVHLESFMHAYALVQSRAWETFKRVSLIPFADFLNHDGTCDSVLLSDINKEVSEVIADRDYVVGEQVVISYGKLSNAELLLDFGFTLQHNKYDQVQLCMDIPSRDPLNAIKTKLLGEYCFPRVTGADKSSTSWNSFTIKEVKSASGKGKGIPQALRAFARVLCATSVEELEDLVREADKSDGRLARCPLKCKHEEIQAHRILCSKLMHMIQGHKAALKALEPTDASDCNSRNSIRTRMAKDLLNGELRVMHSAHAWLTTYCTSLSTWT